MSVANVGPAPEHLWRTSDEVAFVDGLGGWGEQGGRPSHRIQCLKGYLGAFEARAIRGSIDWSHVKAHAVGLLEKAQEKAA